MYTLWLVSDDTRLVAAFEPHLRSIGEVWRGVPEIAAFKEAPAPDLILFACSEGEGAAAEARGLERVLGFLRQVPQPRRAAAPLLWIEAHDAYPPRELLRGLIDDRLLEVCGWPIEPDALAASAALLLAGAEAPAGLRERARREWVTESVERLYAGLELPALRQAIAPGNAAQPLLLVGEPGTRRGLLARYIHNLAEPARDSLLSIRLSELAAHEVESLLLARTAGRRCTVFLRDLDAADREVQEALAELLCESGAVALEPIRWVASALRGDSLVVRLRQWTWLRVELPPLRQRPDRAELFRAVAAHESSLRGRSVALADDALRALTEHIWPGNLRELEGVLAHSLDDCRTAELSAAELRLGGERRLEADLGLELFSSEGESDDDEQPTLESTTELPPPRLERTPSPSSSTAVQIGQLMAPLAEEIRPPLRAIRTYANLVEQRPDDEEVRQELQALVEDDLVRVEATLQRMERFSAYGEPALERVDLAALLGSELEERQARMRERSMVVLRELDRDGPPALADEKQLRFALGALLDRCLRMVPQGGDLYVGSLYQAGNGGPGRHRVLLRFHSPEEVLITPPDVPGPGVPLEVILARDLVERMGGSFAVDSSGSQDNVVLIELPAV